MREIGGYFELEHAIGKEYYEGLHAVNSGRNALLYILQARKITKLWIPCYLCDSVWHVCNENGIDYDFYHVDNNFMPIMDKVLDEKEYIYVVNYFGMLSDAVQMRLKDKYQNLIWDNCQAFFRKPLPDVDTVYTCRKFFGVPDGAYASTEAILGVKLEIDKSYERMQHLLGRLETTGSSFFEQYRQNEDIFNGLPLRKMSVLTHNLMVKVEYDLVKNIREENFRYLHSKLKDYNQLNIDEIEGPFAYPLYTKYGVELRKKLISEKVYVPTLWEDAKGKSNQVELDYIDNILPLPCDQRYNLDDMERICKIIAEE